MLINKDISVYSRKNTLKIRELIIESLTDTWLEGQDGVAELDPIAGFQALVRALLKLLTVEASPVGGAEIDQVVAVFAQFDLAVLARALDVHDGDVDLVAAAQGVGLLPVDVEDLPFVSALDDVE